MMRNQVNAMQSCEHQDQAAMYAMGLLDEQESSAFEHHLSSCSTCAVEVRGSADLAAELAAAPPTATPPAWVRERVLANAKLPRGVLALARRDSLEWKPTPFRGVSMARLFQHPAHGGIASLVRMSPGAHYPSHRHADVEHCFVIEGDLAFEDHTLSAGDYSAGDPNADHGSATTRDGCLLFIVQSVHDQLQAS